MKVTEHLAGATNPLISFEIIPPSRGGDLASLLSFIEDLAEHQPPFIDITSYAAEVTSADTPERHPPQGHEEATRYPRYLCSYPEQMQHRGSTPRAVRGVHSGGVRRLPDRTALLRNCALRDGQLRASRNGPVRPAGPPGNRNIPYPQLAEGLAE